MILKDGQPSTSCVEGRKYILMQIATEMCASPSTSFFLYDLEGRFCTWVTIKTNDHGHTDLSEQVSTEVLKQARSKFMVIFNSFSFISSNTYSRSTLKVRAYPTWPK